MKSANRSKQFSKVGFGLAVGLLMLSSSASAAELVTAEGFARGPLNGDLQLLRTQAFEQAKINAMQLLNCSGTGEQACSRLRVVSNGVQYTRGGGFTEESMLAKASFTLGQEADTLSLIAQTEVSGPKSLGREELVRILREKLTEEVKFDCGLLTPVAKGNELIRDLPATELNPDELGLEISAPFECIHSLN